MIVVKLNKFHGCQGCWRKVNIILSKTKGIETKSIDKEKCLLTITGTMDTKAMLAKLAKMRKDHEVEIVDQDDEKGKEKGVANTINSSTGKPSEEVDTKSSSEEEPVKKTEEISSSAEKPNEIIPSKSKPSEVEGGPSSGQTGEENGAKPMSEHRLRFGPATECVYAGYDYGNGSDYAPSYDYGNQLCNYLQGYADGSGSEQYAIDEKKYGRCACFIM